MWLVGRSRALHLLRYSRTWMSDSDPARANGLVESLARLLSSLDEFNRFEGPDRAAERSAWRPLLEEPLPAEGAGADAVLSLLSDVVVRHGLRLGAPGFCGWVTTGPTVTPVAAQIAGSVAASQRWWTHPSNMLEVQSIRWLAELLGMPANTGGSLVSGGAMANLVGLTAARQHAAERSGIDVASEGVGALPRPRIYAASSVHRVVGRAASILGLGHAALRPVAWSVRRGPDLDELRRAIDEDLAAGATPIAVVASAGDVNTGAVDPIDAMREIAHERGVWLHVDGAYGGFGVLDERVRELYGDLSAIDSLAVDPHKWMAVPVGCGAGLVRDGQLLSRAFAMDNADYVKFERAPDGDPASPFLVVGEGSAEHTPEHSAPSRGLMVWAVLKEIGANGMRARVALHLDCARRVAERVRAHEDLELLAEPVLSICCFRYHPPAIRDQGTLERLNADILAGVTARGRVVPSSTRVDNKLAIRPCFIGARSTLVDADAVVDEVLAVAAELAPGT